MTTLVQSPQLFITETNQEIDGLAIYLQEFIFSGSLPELSPVEKEILYDFDKAEKNDPLYYGVMDGHYRNHQEHEPVYDLQKQKLVKLARIIYPKLFEDKLEYEEHGSRLRLSETDKVLICQRQLEKNHFADYHVRISFFKKEYYSLRDSWRDHASDSKYIDTPVLTVISRKIINKSPFEIAPAMTNFFKANVLLVQEYKWENHTKEGLKRFFKMNNIFIIFANEI